MDWRSRSMSGNTIPISRAFLLVIRLVGSGQLVEIRLSLTLVKLRVISSFRLVEFQSKSHPNAIKCTETTCSFVEQFN